MSAAITAKNFNRHRLRTKSSDLTTKQRLLSSQQKESVSPRGDNKSAPPSESERIVAATEALRCPKSLSDNSLQRRIFHRAAARPPTRGAKIQHRPDSLARQPKSRPH